MHSGAQRVLLRVPDSEFLRVYSPGLMKSGRVGRVIKTISRLDAIFIIYSCVTNYPKFNTLKHHTHLLSHSFCELGIGSGLDGGLKVSPEVAVWVPAGSAFSFEGSVGENT